MFTTFVGLPVPTVGSTDSGSPETQARPPTRARRKRAQVARACDWCRIHRVKCDNDHPCSNCRKRDGQCSNTGLTKTATLPQAYREIENLKQKVAALENQLQEERQRAQQPCDLLVALQPNTPPSLAPSRPPERDPGYINVDTGRKYERNLWEGIRISTARSPHESWFGSSSLFYFLGRADTFLSQTFQHNQPARRVLPDSASRLLDGPSTTATDEQDRRLTQEVGTGSFTDAGEYLSPTQEEYFLSFFWESYHTSYPVLDEAEFKEHYRSLWTTPRLERKSSAIVDIVIALCMQYVMAKLPDAKCKSASRATVDKNDATIAGRWYYRRSQRLLSSELESPTISTLQCHILSSVYLCCGSFQNMSDSDCALAARTAYMLGLHLEPSTSMPKRERELRKRLWWTLYVLESKMSMKLGRPFLLHGYSATCGLPADDYASAMLSGSTFAPVGENLTWLTWILYNTKLLLVARNAHIAFYDTDLDSFNIAYTGHTLWENSKMLEAYAESMQQHTRNLEDWAKAVPSAFKTTRQRNGIPLSIDRSTLEIELLAPLWLQRQRLLLELMYHNLCANIYRPFITFVPATEPTPLADMSAVTCADHAMALTHIMHQVLSSTSILAGWHEAYQWQCNAAMTLVGFVLAYPHGASARAARDAIDLSIITFENFGNSFAAAASAANIVRDLSGKVDLLINQSQERNPSAAMQKLKKVTENLLLVPSSDIRPNAEPFIGESLGATTGQVLHGYMNFDENIAAELL
ncbi:fungal-specific transcription factor domain-containing protein [Xylariales sp. AK1849]|nr:fungal-specific transcription factor domain-containing protein [Xylariales sp. AK1849]